MDEAQKRTDFQSDVQPTTPIKDEEIHAESDARYRSEAGATRSPSSHSTQPPSDMMRQLTDSALHFLSHASNEMLGACLVGLGATTYLILGRVGLLAIGLAGGVVLHASWEGSRHDDRSVNLKQDEKEKIRETALDIAKRLLDLRQRSGTEDLEDARVYAGQSRDYSSLSPKTAAAMTGFTDAIIRDYVHFWYAPTIPGEATFPTACRDTLTAFMLSLAGHLGHKRPADTLLDFTTNASSITIVFLNELSAALHASPNARPEDAITTYLQNKPESSLSYMLNENSQSRKLADAAEDILQAYLDPKSYNCQPVHAFLKEVLSRLILGYTIVTCSQPDWLNGWIVYGLEESETTKEVMDMVDASVENRPTEDSRIVTPSSTHIDRGLSSVGTEILHSEKSTVPKEHRRQKSRAEEAMDEAMKEAQRLTQMMIEEDERRIREEQDKQAAMQSSGDLSDAATQGIVTPSSSQSENGGSETFTSTKSLPEIADVDNDGARFVSPERSSVRVDSSQHAEYQPVIDSPIRQQQQTLSPLTLHNANVSIFDDSAPGERASIKAKPSTDYLIQIEPTPSVYPGWMIARKYTDFEMLHEVLRRISIITGVPEFTNKHADLPKWKGNTKATLRKELERYIIDAVRYQPLAESEGMKRFLDKDQALSKSPGHNKGFGWPAPDAFGKLGGDVMQVLTKAPKSVAGGGKAVLGGVAGLVGGVAGQKKSNLSQHTLARIDSTSSVSIDTAGPQNLETSSARASMHDVRMSAQADAFARPSQDSAHSAAKTSFSTDAPSGSLYGVSSATQSNTSLQTPTSVTGSVITMDTPAKSETGSSTTSPSKAIPTITEETIANYQLPPRPDEIADDFGSPASTRNTQRRSHEKLDQPPNGESSSKAQSSHSGLSALSRSDPSTGEAAEKARSQQKSKRPLSESETMVAVELVFAIISELYTLSSVWNIRRTLLNAAKTFLLRPGNPQLLSIQQLLQTSLLESNLSDDGIASHIDKLRANTLPTAEELEEWKRDYPEKTAEQKEQLRIKARHLLVTKGMPQALTSVMGAAASGEALGKVFDCLQIPSVSQGFVFGLLLQALKIVTQ